MEKECACPEAAAAGAINSGVSATCPAEEMIHLSRPSGPGPRDQDEDHVVQFHVNPGVTVSLQVGDSVRVVKGPMTVPMVPTAGRPSQPPIPMPVQVPVGHVVHQIMDEAGQLRHVILSTQRPPEGQPPPPPPEYYHAGYYMVPPHMPMPQPPAQVWPDDRSRMQKEKMKKRLEQRHATGGPPTPLASPAKKTPVNRRSKEASSPPPAVPSSPGLQLSVCDVQQTSANLSWATADSASVSGSEDSGVAEAPQETCTTMYQLSIRKKGKDQQIVYFGTDLAFQLDNLNPGTEYSVRLAAVPAGEGGTASGTAYMTFTTQPAAPEMPKTISFGGRTKTSLTLKWQSCSNGGSSITAYILEMAENPDGPWGTAYRGRERQFVVPKLLPGTTYYFRLAAENALGQSPFCNVLAFTTQEPPPAAPNPPRLAAAASHDRLKLVWDPVKSAENYMLEQADDASPNVPHFHVIHHGPENQLECRNLQPASAYLFRLKVDVNGQRSQPSAHARLVTAPTTPVQPSKPLLKGRTHPNSIRVAWTPPIYNGGAPVLEYKLQMDRGQGFQEVWSGQACEAVIGDLAPGSAFLVRVAAVNVAGLSMFSETSRVATSAAPPGAPTWSRRQQPASAHAAALRWAPPTVDGGAPVLHYEVEVADSHSRRQAYHGAEPFCVVANLPADTACLFWVRAANSAGAGPWSAELPLTTAVAPPMAPEPPSVDVNDDGVAFFSWLPLVAATSYGLQLALLEEHSAEPQFKQEFSGAESNCQVANLAPGSTYLARLQGMNSSGSGPFSTPVVFCTNVSVPGPVAHAPRRVSLKSDGTEAQLVVTFEQPAHWGGDPQGPLTFLLEAASVNTNESPLLFPTAEPTATIMLPLESSYRLKVRAVNSKGQGPASPTLKVTTPPPPPSPPNLRMVQAQPRALRLAWDADEGTCVVVEMRRMETHKFKVVYEGFDKACKVTQLQKNTDYQFRTRAEGPGGQGSPGPVVTFRTKSAPVPFPGNLAVTEVTADSFLVSWQAPPEHKSKLQVATSRHGPFKLVYEGSECQFWVTELGDELKYWVRASLSFEGEEGQWTPAVAASVLSPVKSVPEASPRPEKTVAAHVAERRPRKRVILKEKQKIIIYTVGFLVLAVLLAYFLKRAVTM